MDDRQFDELSKRLSTGLSRKGILKLLGGVGAAGLSAASILLPAEAKKKRARKKNKNNNKGRDNNDNDANDTAAAQPEAKKAKGKGKGKGKKGKGKNRKNKNQSNNQKQGDSQGTTKAPVNVEGQGTCPSGKILLCHSGSGSNYTEVCSDASSCSGHANDQFDCICQSTALNCTGGGTIQPCSALNVACGVVGGDNNCQGCATGTTACGAASCCTSGQKCCDGVCVETSTLCGGVCGNVCKSDETCCDNTTCKPNSSFCGGSCKTCPTGQKCCNGTTCIPTGGCCKTSECEVVTCQDVECAAGECDYTPVDNGDQGPNCTGSGETCCNGKECCVRGEVCTGEGCCTPKTCAADYPGQCGTFPQGCNLPDLTCGCPQGQGCCDKKCVAGNQCCNADQCDAELCKTVVCEAGSCDYTPVDDGDQGPLCNGKDEFCCGGDTCCTSPEVCTREGECCVPKTCAVDYPGKCGKFPQGCGLPDLTCGCPQGQGCCGDTCVAGTECCASENCDAELCKTVVCEAGSCDYTPVDDGDQGPLCNRKDEFCCGGDTCCTSPEVCTREGECCVPKTCAVDYPGKCGKFPQGCGLPDLTCGCPEGQGCCSEICVSDDQCCVADNCEPELCKTVVCDDGSCDYTPVEDDEQGPLCDDEDEFCCGGDTCCTSPQVCTDEGDCCLPKTCAVDYPGQCGTFAQGCGLPDLTCTCPEGGCCEGTCQGGKECCAGSDCEKLVCRTADCSEGDCVYEGEPDNEPGTLCDDEGDFCCNGNECCEAGEICTGEGCCTPKTCAVEYAGQCGTFSQGCGLPDLTCECKADEQCNPQGICVLIPDCVPVPISQACSGLQCGPASNGCGVDYDCGLCKKKKRKGQRPINQSCVAGVCKPFKKKRCIGGGLAGHPCSGKCKCKNGRRCNNGRCCEGVGDGSRHCNSNSECCPGLMCAFRRPGQHRVCMPRNAKGIFTESTESTATPGIAIGAILTGLAATMGAKLTGNGEAASVAMDEVQIHALGPRD